MRVLFALQNKFSYVRKVLSVDSLEIIVCTKHFTHESVGFCYWVKQTQLAKTCPRPLNMTLEQNYRSNIFLATLDKFLHSEVVPPQEGMFNQALKMVWNLLLCECATPPGTIITNK